MSNKDKKKLLDRGRVTVVKSGSVTENHFRRKLVYFAFCAHRKTRLIVTFLAFITGHVPDLATRGRLGGLRVSVLDLAGGGHSVRLAQS
jgi:hypothetical protein